MGIDELRQFQFKYGTLDQSENYEKARKGIAEYAGTKMDKDMWRLAWHKEEREFEEPTDPGEKPTPGQMEKYKMELKIDLEEKKNYTRVEFDDKDHGNDPLTEILVRKLS